MLDPLVMALLPPFLSLQKERLDLLFVAASLQFPIPPASCQRLSSLVVRMVLVLKKLIPMFLMILLPCHEQSAGPDVRSGDCAGGSVKKSSRCPLYSENSF
jgi:hypothetical protein